MTYEKSNDCPFQVKRNMDGKKSAYANDWVTYNQNSGNDVYSGGLSVCHELASTLNTEWFFQKYVG